MALRWDLSKVVDSDKFFFTAEEDNPDFWFGWSKGDDVMHPTAHVIVWGMMAIGMGQITAKNAATVYARLAFVERLGNAWRRHKDTKEPVYVTPEEVRSLIGLKVNVSEETDAAWNRRMMTEKIKTLQAEYTKEVQ